MAIREILIYPKQKKQLRTQSKPIKKIDNKTKQFIQNLKDTLKASPDGIGLAAPQINYQKRIIVACPDIDEHNEWQAGPPRVFINPEIIEANDEGKDFDGCLSFPGLFGQTVRPHFLKVKWIDLKGKSQEQVFAGFNAVLVHHEIDHLDGILFIDRIEDINDLYRQKKDGEGKYIHIGVRSDDTYLE